MNLSQPRNAPSRKTAIGRMMLLLDFEAGRDWESG